jgi:hypothetical protein
MLATLARIDTASQGMTLGAHQCPDYVSTTHGQQRSGHSDEME